MSIRFRPAAPEDDADLRALLRRNVMEGSIAVTFRREPSYFQAAAVQGETAEVYTSVDTANGTLAGLGGRFRLPAWFNGEAAVIGYLADLRVETDYRSGISLRRAYDFLRDRHQADPLPVYTTMILQDNQAALRVLAAGRAGMPPYRPQGFVHTPMLVLARPKPPVRLADTVIRPARTGEETALFDFINREHRRRQFAPIYAPQDLHNGRLRGVSVEDFWLAERGGEIVGTLAGWDQHAFRQIHVEHYRGFWRLCKPFYNALARITPLHRLPENGGILHYGYVALTAIKHDDVDVFRALLRALYRQRRRSAWHYMVCALHECDPLLPVLHEYSAIAAGGHLFTVAFDENGTPPDGRVPYIEAGAL